MPVVEESKENCGTQLTYIFPKYLITTETVYILNTKITKLGGGVSNRAGKLTEHISVLRFVGPCQRRECSQASF